MKLTHYEWAARAVAFDEVAEHLDSGQHWTDDLVELEQGREIARRFRTESIKCQQKAKMRVPNDAVEKVHS